MLGADLENPPPATPQRSFRDKMVCAVAPFPSGVRRARPITRLSPAPFSLHLLPSCDSTMLKLVAPRATTIWVAAFGRETRRLGRVL